MSLATHKSSGRFKAALWLVAASNIAALLLFLPIPHGRSLAHTQPGQSLAAYDTERSSRQSRFKVDLASRDRSTFESALKALSEIDEEGTLEVWKTAIGNSDPELRKEAWIRYRSVWPRLSREERVPEVVRFSSSKAGVASAAVAAGVSLSVFSVDATGCIAALPPFLVNRMARAGMPSSVLYASLSEMDGAARRSDATAIRLTKDYRASLPHPTYQIRVAVIDLEEKRAPASGYSDWLGDPEDVLMRHGLVIAYLDVFASDGSTESIAAHIRERYTGRGYTLKGFFTMDEFAERAPAFFPGESFSAGQKIAGGISNAVTDGPLNNGAFHSYDQALAEFTALAQANPNIAQLVTLGSTFEGREVFALKISSNVSVDDPAKPNVLFTGCHHAREWISVEPPIYFANQLISNYSGGGEVKYLVDHLQIWIVPIVNPDGLSFSQQSPNNQLDQIRLWRKNRNPVNISGCLPGVGVDLNRNYDFEWRLPGDLPCPSYNDDVGASDDALDETFRGPSPDSELEIQALNVLTDDPNHHFQARLDYHNFHQLVLYPWGYQAGTAPDLPNLANLSSKMAALIRSQVGAIFTPEQGIDLYITTGDSTDYAYGVDSVPVPFTVELQPICCNFNVPESAIGPTDQAHWPTALLLMDWSSGPPILQSVKAFELGGDGAFSNLVYSAHWTASLGARQLVIDTHVPNLQAGPMQVQLQFSKPMDPAAPISVSLGAAAPFNQLTVAPVPANAGWQTATYANDTWVGEVTLPSGGQTAWTLAVSASDLTPLKLDGNPATVAGYLAGSGGWQGYEDALGAAGAGGTDTQNSIGGNLPPGEGPVIAVDGPTGGVRLAGGDQCNITWTLPQSLWFTVAQQQIWLSTDGGATFSELAENLDPSLNSYTVTLPPVATAQARIKIIALDASLQNTVQGMERANFTIGENVGKGLTVSLVSSALTNESWSYSRVPGQSAESGPSQLAITVNVTNSSNVLIANSFFQVDSISKGNVLLSADPNGTVSPSTVQSVNSGSGGTLAPGQSVQVRLVVGLVSIKSFKFSADILGVPSGSGVAASKQPDTIWSGKPRTRSH